MIHQILNIRALRRILSCIAHGLLALAVVLAPLRFALAQPLPLAPAPAAGTPVAEIRVEGNRAVQPEAIRGLMSTSIGKPLDPGELKADIKAIHRSGFFRDVAIERVPSTDGKLILLVKVSEKPSIREIRFTGFDAVSSSSLADKLQVKRFTIVDERKLAGDLRTIEQSYVEKGYYLARAGYALEPLDSGEVAVRYTVVENNPVSVRRVNLLGNAHFGEAELKAGMLTREKRWSSWMSGGGHFKDEFASRDQEYLKYIYNDSGFAEATVTAPQARLDRNRQSVDVGYFIEEGERFRIGKIKLAGDLLFPDEFVKERLSMKEGAWFRISQFQADIKKLQDLYGDEGYAFADPLPKTAANRDTRVIDIEFTITKGEKVYIRNIVVEGNSKTRDNVIRRNMKLAEGDRFHATNLEKSKAAIERLGFFQEVQILREPDMKTKTMDLRIKVKEKMTGQLSASVGASPGPDGRGVQFFAEGNYSEANLLGYGWGSGIKGKVSPNTAKSFDYSLMLSFAEPSINDGPWSFDAVAEYSLLKEARGLKEPPRDERTRALSFGIGREIIEDLRVSLGYRISALTISPTDPLWKDIIASGRTETLSQTVAYDKTDNYLNPTSGVYLRLNNELAFPMLLGEHEFGRTQFSAALYVPLTFFEDFKTNFRFAIEPGYMYSLRGKRTPVWERFKLGNNYNMKAYNTSQIGPQIQFLRNPRTGPVDTIVIGGNRRLFGSAEYFLPLIPEANLRFVLFGEAGAILAERESFSLDKMKYDVGLGFRWQTPIAPFRFEWAWPLKDGKLGESQFIFMVGSDNASIF